jgi:single-strand DNA-binding protein
MTFEIEGILHKTFEVESKSASFQTREFVITTEGTYPQYVKFQLTQDKCGIIDGYPEGEKIKVSFDLRGREWQGKYFTNLNAWKVDKVAGNSQGFQAASAAPPIPPVFEENTDFGGGLPSDFDDLPF